MPHSLVVDGEDILSLLAAVSHDLRTPLTRIRLRGELIGDEVQRARLFRDVAIQDRSAGAATCHRRH